MIGPHELGGRQVTLESIRELAYGAARVEVPGDAWRRVAAAQQRLIEARRSGTVYGANTGVGANRSVHVDDSSEQHGLRLLRSHCVGVGPREPAPIIRAALAIRLNQILAGGAGVSVTVAQALLAALNTGSLPVVHSYGAIGTGDLSQLAETALTLIGEREWGTAGIAPVAVSDTDALPFISSNAFTIAHAALAAEQLTVLLDALEVVTALSFLALRGSRQAWHAVPNGARPHPCQVDVARRLSDLVRARHGQQPHEARLQDPFGLRAVPQVHAPVLADLARLRTAVELEMGSAVENPLVTRSGVFHHGQFHLATLSADLDHVRGSLVPLLSLSASRLTLLTRPAETGLAAFLSDRIPGSSGLMIGEYVVQDALARARSLAVPVRHGEVSISLGVEEHASFATQGARQLMEMLEPMRVLAAVEVVAAVRALRQDPSRLIDCPARAGFELLAAVLPTGDADRPWGEDIRAACDMLPALAALSSSG